jgi:sugar phosphate isomerase/epimerase
MNRDEFSVSNRRAFLRELAALGAGGSLLAACARASSGAAAPSPGGVARVNPAARQPTVDRIGVQLYTVADVMRQDFDGTLEKVAGIGYRYVEFAGYFDRTPEQVRATLDRLNLKAPSSHIGMELLRRDLDAQIHIGQVIGHEYLTIPSLGRTETPMTTADAWKRIADECNAIGAKVKAAGLKLAFHSHSGEFIDVGGGKTGMDVFLTGTDPELFTFEMDLGWARVASQDPVAWFQKYPGRFRMWHVKDFESLKAAQDRQTAAFKREAEPRPAQPAGPPNGPPPAGGNPFSQPGKPVPIGAGDIDFRPIFAAWQTAGLEYFFVEQDGAAFYPGGSLASIETSYQALRKLLA